MSKVYSFRLSDDNPREAQAREVIEVWVEDGYSLRYILVEALVNYQQHYGNYTEIENLLGQFREMILSIDMGIVMSTSHF